MPGPAIVLVHGGQHGGDCWEPTIAELNRRAPDIPVLAVDLPGRRSRPADLATVTIGNCEDSVVADIEAAGFDQVVIVGHSQAGLTVPGVVTKLGADRVARMILIAANVPPQGQSTLDTLNGAMRWYAARAARRGKPAPPMHPLFARMWFCNGMTPAQREFVLSRLYGESTRMIAEPSDRSALPRSVPRTWVLTLQDKVQSQAAQRRSIEALGGVDHIVELDTCHDAMVSAPRELADILLDHCRTDATP